MIHWLQSGDCADLRQTGPNRSKQNSAPSAPVVLVMKSGTISDVHVIFLPTITVDQAGGLSGEQEMTAPENIHKWD